MADKKEANRLIKESTSLSFTRRHATMILAAEHLAGQRVNIAFERPRSAGELNGAQYKDLSGTAWIHIHPEKKYGDDEELLRVFLHEVAHVKKHHAIMRPINVADKRLLLPATDYASPSVKAREVEAESQADVWQHYVKENWQRYSYAFDDRFEAKLQCLLKYPKGAINVDTK